MAINERLIDTEVAAAGNGGGLTEAEQGLILHLDANDVDSYDGDGAEWVDISEHDVIVPLSDNDSNLKVHIDFADTSCYSGTGTTVNDLSSNNTTINTLSGSVEADFERGFLNVSESSNEGLTISDHADFDHTNGATYEGWVYLDPNGTSEETFFFRGPTNAQGLRVYWHSSYGWFPRDFNASGSEIMDQNNIKTGTSGFGRGKWYHLALTLSSASAATYKFYVDGNLIGSYTASGGGQNSLSYDISLGKYIGSASDLHGKIAQFRFYNKVLSASEIGQNYRHGRNNSYTELIPDTDLELHLDADSFPERGEAGYSNTPSTWTALTGSNGTISGATFDSELGNWLDFDGVNDYVQITPIPSTLQSDAIITGEAWIYPKTATNNSIISFRGAGSSTIKFFLAADSSSRLYLVSASTSGFLVFGTTANNVVPVNQWTHVAATINYATKDYYIYANGELVSSGTQSNIKGAGTFSAANLFVGTNLIGTQHSNLKIGQARIYSSALTQYQIRQNYNFTKPSYPNGYDGTISGATWNAGGYFDFDGSNDYIDLTALGLGGNKSRSVSVWVKADSLATNRPVFCYGNESTGQGFNFEIKTNGAILVGYYSRDWTTTTAPITTNTWHHIVITYNGGLTQDASNTGIYVNNVPLDKTSTGSYTGVANTSNNSYEIGKRKSFRYFDGQIDSVKVYDKALTQAEITALYNEGQ